MDSPLHTSCLLTFSPLSYLDDLSISALPSPPSPSSPLYLPSPLSSLFPLTSLSPPSLLLSLPPHQVEHYKGDTEDLSELVHVLERELKVGRGSKEAQSSERCRASDGGRHLLPTSLHTLPHTAPSSLPIHTPLLLSPSPLYN